MVQDVDDRGRDGMTEEREVRSGGVVRGGRNTSTGQFTATSGVSAPLLCSASLSAAACGLWPGWPASHFRFVLLSLSASTTRSCPPLAIGWFP
jgi:hypothetical protein